MTNRQKSAYIGKFPFVLVRAAIFGLYLVSGNEFSKVYKQ